MAACGKILKMIRAIWSCFLLFGILPTREMGSVSVVMGLVKFSNVKCIRKSIREFLTNC